MTRLFAILAVICAPVLAWAEIEIKEVRSPDGIDAWLVEEHAIPFVSIELIFDGGASLDLPGKRGATNLMMALIEEGAGDMDARAFQTAREDLAASYSFEAFDDSVSVSARFLTENRDVALELLRLALTEPRFDEDAIERVRSQVQSVIRSDATNPNRIAGAAFDAAAFGDHPYGSSLNGTLESVAALTRDDLLEAYRNAFVRGRVHVGAAGDITGDELGALLDDLLSGLPEDGPDLPERADYALSGGVTVVPFDGPQSVAMFGHTGIERDADEFFAAYILNEILGGSGLRSRLMREVREARGLTYGVYSYLVPKDHAELYMGSMSASNARIAEAIEVVRAETGAYPLRFDGNGRIASILAGMQRTGLPVDYVANRNAYIEAVTLDEVRAVAADLLQPDALHFVVVGQPEGLEVN